MIDDVMGFVLDSPFGLLVIVGVVSGATALLVLACVSIESRMSFPQHLAQIEQLRLDASRVEVGASEDVIGQVVSWNQRIASEQACNRLWYCDFTATDEWDGVGFIPVPQR